MLLYGIKSKSSVVHCEMDSGVSGHGENIQRDSDIKLLGGKAVIGILAMIGLKPPGSPCAVRTSLVLKSSLLILTIQP